MKFVFYPNPTLSVPSTPVLDIPSIIRSNLIPEMFKEMYEKKGVGLAAPQIGQNIRLFVTNTKKGAQSIDERVYINPEILEMSGEKKDMPEGCLSLPFVWGNVRRHLGVRIKAQNADGVEFEEMLEGLDAQAIQHEMDHLDGRLIIERFSAADTRLNAAFVKELEKRWEEGKE